LAISDDDTILVVGFESGAIAAYDIMRDSMMKYFEEIHKARVLIVKILFKNKLRRDRMTI
jgi:hypothetical protein